MAQYVMLLKYTAQGIRDVQDTTKRAAAFSKSATKMGAKLKNILWTLGQYDLVSTIEAPNDETVAALAISLGKNGNISVQTLRGFTSSEMDGILKKVG